jgi:hypothetical protein
MVTAEDDPADTLIPRLKAARADLSKIRLIDASVNPMPDVDAVEREIQLLSDVRLVVIDPIAAFLKSANLQRVAADQLARLASRWHLSVVVVSHLAKAAASSALNRIAGNVGLAAAARSVFMVERENGTERRLFVPVKSSLNGKPNGIAFRIKSRSLEDGMVSSAVAWDPAPVTVTADELGSQSAVRKRTALSEAEEFLRLVLSDGPLRPKELKVEASDAGVSWASLRRAADNLGVQRVRVGGAADNGHWQWELARENPETRSIRSSSE